MNSVSYVDFFPRFYSRLILDNVTFYLKLILRGTDAPQLLRGSRRSCMRRNGAIAERANGKGKERPKDRTSLAQSRRSAITVPNRWICHDSIRPKLSGDRRADFTSIFARFALLVLRTLNDYITVTPITKPHAVSNILKDLINR